MVRRGLGDAARRGIVVSIGGIYRSRMNPSLERNFEAMDPLEWLARVASARGQAAPKTVPLTGPEGWTRYPAASGVSPPPR